MKIKIVNSLPQFPEQYFVRDVWKYRQVVVRTAHKEDGYRQCCKVEM